MLGRFAVSYAKLSGTQIRSRAEEFDSLAEAALFFNKMCIDYGKNLSVTLCDTKANTVLQHYAHNHFPYRFNFITEQSGEDSAENPEDSENADGQQEEETLPSPDEYKEY